MEMIGGLAGAAGSIVSGILGAKAANRAANINWQINLMNYYQRERERKEAMRRADEALAEQHLGSTDIRGTTTKFVPGVGWVVTAAPSVKQMMDLQDKAQMDVLNKDIPMRRKVMERNYVRGLADEANADALRQQFKNVRMGSDDAIAADLYLAATSGIREGARDNANRVFTHALRTAQNSNFPKIAQNLADSENAAFKDAALKARLTSRGVAAKEYDARRQGLAGLYNMFAGRAGQVPDVAYKPQGFSEGDIDALSKQSLSASAQAAQIAGMKGGTLDYIQPNYGMANAVGGGASALASALRMGGAASRRSGSGNVGGGETTSGVQGFGGSSLEGGGQTTGFVYPTPYSGSADMYLGSTGTSWGD